MEAVASTLDPEAASTRLSPSSAPQCRVWRQYLQYGGQSEEHDDMGNDQLWAIASSLTPSIVIGGSVM